MPHKLKYLMWASLNISRNKVLTKNNNMETHEYPNGEITILWKPNLCIHAGVCVKTLSKVYNPKARPWIKIENATTQELKDQVAKCPSGALSIKEELNSID